MKRFNGDNGQQTWRDEIRERRRERLLERLNRSTENPRVGRIASLRQERLLEKIELQKESLNNLIDFLTEIEDALSNNHTHEQNDADQTIALPRSRIEEIETRLDGRRGGRPLYRQRRTPH